MQFTSLLVGSVTITHTVYERQKKPANINKNNYLWNWKHFRIIVHNALLNTEGTPQVPYFRYINSVTSVHRSLPICRCTNAWNTLTSAQLQAHWLLQSLKLWEKWKFSNRFRIYEFIAQISSHYHTILP